MNNERSLNPNDSLDSTRYEIGHEEIKNFNRLVTEGKDTKNIHTDDAIAQKAGLPRAVATGRHPVCFIAEEMTKVFGKGFIENGNLDVKFIKPIFPGDTIKIKFEFYAKEAFQEFEKFTFNVSIKNQDGETVTKGITSGIKTK
ncbi:MAG: MaoC family dehydratase [Nitrospinota bacterium]|nr:MaoC family dehydratase [Nitrospinota bacterium]